MHSPNAQFYDNDETQESWPAGTTPAPKLRPLVPCAPIAATSRDVGLVLAEEPPKRLEGVMQAIEKDKATKQDASETAGEPAAAVEPVPAQQSAEGEDEGVRDYQQSVVDFQLATYEERARRNLQAAIRTWKCDPA